MKKLIKPQRKKYQESTSGPIDKHTRMFASFIPNAVGPPTEWSYCYGGPLWNYELSKIRKEYLKKIKKTK